MNPTKFKYPGALPTGSATVTLFECATTFTRRVSYAIDCSHDGTVNGYWSADGGTTWVEFYENAVTAPAAGAVEEDDVFVEPYPEVRFTWTNGGTNQTSFVAFFALSDDRAAA
jgi:hypothetical protein